VIDPRAVISPKAELAADVTVGAFSVIGPDVVIGPGTTIAPHAVLNGPMRIGGTTHDKGVTRIGNDNLFMAYSHVAHDCQLGNNLVFANCATLGGHIEIGDWVTLGGISAIHQFCKIGSYAFIAGGSIVTRDVPPYVMVAGNPCEPHSINAVGLERRGFTPEQIRNVKNAFRILYRSDLKLADAVTQLTELGKTQPEVQAFVDFIARSTRSLVR
jgi:UDP-N-acetylglucosamine acyltransferase